MLTAEKPSIGLRHVGPCSEGVFAQQSQLSTASYAYVHIYIYTDMYQI